MVEIKPFNGFYYNQEIVDLAHVVTPPHDVITPEGQESYYNSSPYNIVRLILGKHYGADTAKNNCYTRAADYLNNWVNKKILIPDDREAIYAYEQTYTLGKRKKRHLGMVALLKLEPFGSRAVLPHEEVSKKSISDRYELIRACNANMSLTISLYLDKKKNTDKILKKEANKKPFIDVKDRDNVQHRVWPIYEKKAIERLSNELKDKKLYIADGHHRYTTALKYSQKTKNPQAKYMMVFLLNMGDDLTVLPSHRIVKTNPKSMKKLQEFFTIEDHKMTPVKTKDSHKFGMYHDGEFYTLKLKKRLNLDGLIKGKMSAAWKQLDVTVLHTLILEKILRVGLNNVIFTKDRDKAIRFVDLGEYNVAFFLNPTRVEQVMEIADNGERMPQKSTYFYPKTLSGLVIRKF